MVGEMQRPAEVGCVLMEVLHQEPAECATREADCGRDCDAPSHEMVRALTSCNMKRIKRAGRCPKKENFAEAATIRHCARRCASGIGEHVVLHEPHSEGAADCR